MTSYKYNQSDAHLVFFSVFMLKNRNVTNYLIVSLAFSDLLVGLFVMPLATMLEVYMYMFLTHCGHIQGSAFYTSLYAFKCIVGGGQVRYSFDAIAILRFD